MNSKSKINIYKKIIKEVCEKYDGEQEFITDYVLKKEYLLMRYVHGLK